MFENYPSLLVTKLYVPRLRATQVVRTQLLTMLNSGLERKLILIAAAAGFGKTTLVADWCSQLSGKVGWYSLDDGDNDPIRFLSYFVASIQFYQPQVGEELLAALQSPQPPTIEHALHSLINQMTGFSERLILVLDDYHVIENASIHQAVSFLLEHLPLHITMVILTRTDPPLPLARLRARNELLELRAAELRFRADETGRFLNEIMQVGIPTEAIDALERRTEGWIAGLQLAAIALQTFQGDKQAFIQQFTGSHRFILDYLIEEVLSRQPEAVRLFLLQSSILRRLNGELCEAVTGHGQAMLEYLERHNLFLIPLDQSRYWYRYHHLFADLLQARLQAEYPAMLRELRGRAAHWHEANGLPEEAVVYALKAEDFGYAAALITGPAISVMRRSETTTLLEWYRGFPENFVQERSRLSLQFGMAFALSGRWEEAESLLDAVEKGIGSELRSDEVLMFSYLVASKRQDRAWLDKIAAQAETSAQHDATTKLVLALLVSVKGDLRYACQLLAEAQEAGERDGDIALTLTALFHQCRLHTFQGNLRQAYALCEQALERIHMLGSMVLSMATFAHSSLGRILIEWNELEKANEHLHEAIRLGERSGLFTGVVSSATIMLAEVQQAQGEALAANRTAEEAMRLAERYDPASEVVWLKAYQARIWLTQGNNVAADVWMQDAARKELPLSLFYPAQIQDVTEARVLLTRRKLDEAITLLTKLTQLPQHLLTVEALALLALARQTNGDSVNALLTLEQALALGAAENRIRVFLDLGAPMAKLLTRFCDTHPNNEFARKLLAVLPGQDAEHPVIDALGEREIEVLRLIVAGQSNDEIAETLTLAVSTVKWYINVLYGKLHVKTRSQAIARAHELKLV